MRQYNKHQLLFDEGEAPFAIGNPEGASDVLLICEHASNVIPESLGDLGLDAAALSSHIAWDPGALSVASEMGNILDATSITGRFSRLVYDCNRPPEAVGAMPGKSEIYTIPGNSDLSEAGKKLRVDSIYRPFTQAIADTIRSRISDGRPPVLVTIHSFTPTYHGKTRKVELGILHDSDATLADGILDAAQLSSKLKVERNQPYGAQDGVTHTLQLHAIPDGLLNVMIEIRNDLIVTSEQQLGMAQELAGLVTTALNELNILQDETMTTSEPSNA